VGGRSGVVSGARPGENENRNSRDRRTRTAGDAKRPGDPQVSRRRIARGSVISRIFLSLPLPLSHPWERGLSPHLRRSLCFPRRRYPPDEDREIPNPIDSLSARQPQGRIQAARRPRTRAPQGSRPARGRRAQAARRKRHAKCGFLRRRPAARPKSPPLYPNCASNSALNMQMEAGNEGCASGRRGLGTVLRARSQDSLASRPGASGSKQVRSLKSVCASDPALPTVFLIAVGSRR